MPEHLIGEIPGQAPGTTYVDRRALSAAGIHRPLQAGIAGSGATGAESIVLNGGYEDDEDFWEYIVYTGQGGNDPATGRQVADQELTRGNLALARSCDDRLPVRVVRGWKEPSGYGPPTGFRYDGLYYVESYWQERGRSVELPRFRGHLTMGSASSQERSPHGEDETPLRARVPG